MDIEVIGSRECLALNQSELPEPSLDNYKLSEMAEPSVDTDKLSYEIFSILESKFLFGYDDQKLWIPKHISPSIEARPDSQFQSLPEAITGVSAMKNQTGKVCILSIDGGGMRGILAGKALTYIENALKTKSGNPDASIADYFDVSAGSGVGGIFTAMLFATKEINRPMFKANDTWQFLAEHSNRFHRSGSSSNIFRRLLKGKDKTTTGSATTGLEKAMKEAFSENGRSLTLKDTLKPVLIPCYDLSSSAPFLFSRADAFETDSYDFQLWEVCRATSAEPGLFEPVSMLSVDKQTKCLAIDGGLTMSNPTAAAITHVLHNKKEFPFVRGVEDILVLSLGTGEVFEGNYEYNDMKKWTAKEWARPMTRISEEGSADMVDQAVAMAFGPSRSSNYVRIQANALTLVKGRSLDTKMLVEQAEEMLIQKNVESVLFGGKKIAEWSNFEKLDWFAGELVMEHQRRSCRIAPTVSFKQTTPK